MTKQEILREARQLDRDERVSLALEFWEIVGEAPPITPALAAELDRRLAEDRKDPAPAEDWETLREKLLRGEI